MLNKQNATHGNVFAIPSDGVDRDSGDILSLCLSRLEPRVPIHLHCPDSPRLTVGQIDLIANAIALTLFRLRDLAGGSKRRHMLSNRINNY